MRKFLLTFIIIALVSTPIFANPKPSGNFNSKVFIGVVSVLTLGLGFLFYKAFTNKDKVEFTNEEVNISLNKDNVINVVGYYYFKRTGKSINTFEILYPFPKQKQYGEIEIDSITINDKEVKYHQFELKRYNRISLTLSFNETDECELRIAFKQKPLNSSYKYILKTTKKWKKELEESIINISLPASKDLQSNYTEFVQKENLNKNRSEFKMKKVNFYPSEDLFISWIER